MGQSKTSKFYAENPESAEKRRVAQRKINKSKEQKEYRAELNGKRRELGIYGKSKEGGKAALDVAHKKSRKDGGTLKDGFKLQNKSTNRAKK
jgi:hypothetical protein